MLTTSVSLLERLRDYENTAAWERFDKLYRRFLRG
jgi:hypothetical protein